MKMKIILKICLLMTTLIFVSSSFTFAETNDTSLVDTFSFKAGVDFRNLNYEEPDMELDGLMYGVSGKLVYHGINKKDNHLMAGVELEYLSGNLDYDGETQRGVPVESDSDNSLFETRGLVGYDYLTDNTNLRTPFTGIGYRYWYNDIKGSGGYQREVRYWYAPIGIMFMNSLSENWTGGITAEYDLFLGGTVKSYLSDADSRLNDLENNQDTFDGYGFRFSVHLTRKFERSGLSLSFKPYIRYWDINKSNKETVYQNGTPIGYAWEPANETSSYGMSLSLSF